MSAVKTVKNLAAQYKKVKKIRKTISNVNANREKIRKAAVSIGGLFTRKSDK